MATVDIGADSDGTSHDQPENDTSSKGAEAVEDDNTHNQLENDISSKRNGTENGPPKFTVEQEQLFKNDTVRDTI